MICAASLLRVLSEWTGCRQQWSNFEGVADQAVAVTHDECYVRYSARNIKIS